MSGADRGTSTGDTSEVKGDMTYYRARYASTDGCLVMGCAIVVGCLALSLLGLLRER